jgi:hypothetical protein
MSVSIKGQGYSLLGTGSYTPLLPGSDPASQYSLTAPGVFPFVFSGAFGGTSPLAYSLGTGYGTVVGAVAGAFPNYTLTLSNVESYYVVVVNTTDTAGQIVQSYGFAATAPAADLLPGGNAVSTAQLSPATTSTVFSFGAFSGGSGTISYAASIQASAFGPFINPVTGLGPYTLGNLSPGVVVIAQIEATDGTGQTARNWTAVAVQPTPTSDLVAGATPARQNLAFGSTSANVTFNAFSGGTAPYSYSAALITGTGSTASLSGSGLGPYTVSNLTNGEAVEVVLTATDSGSPAQVATSTAFIYVAASVSASLTAPAPSPSAFQNAAGVPTLGPVTLGSFSSAVTLASQVGTSDNGASPGITYGGSGAGPYDVSLTSLRDGVVYRIQTRGTATDGSGRAQNTGIAVSVGGGQPQPVTDNVIDLTTVTTNTNIAITGTYPLVFTQGGSFSFVTSVSVGTPSRVINSQPGVGINIGVQSTGEAMSCGIILDSWLASLPVDQDIFVEWLIAGWTAPTTGSYYQCSIGSQINALANVTYGVRITRDTAGSQDTYRARRYDASASTLGATANLGAFLTNCSIQLLIRSNRRYPQTFLVPNATTFQPIGTGIEISPGRSAYTGSASAITTAFSGSLRPAIMVLSTGAVLQTLTAKKIRYGTFR